MSGRLKSALKSVPATNPICTDRVNHPAAVGLKCHSRVSEGTTADPLNHNDMPSSSATASKVSVRQRCFDSLRESVAEFCKPQIVAPNTIHENTRNALLQRSKPPTAVGRWLMSSPGKELDLLLSEYHQRKLVDCSDPS